MAGSSASARSACRVERPRDGGLEVAPADAEAVAQPHTGGIEQAHHLLRAGAGRRHHADRTGPHDVGEPEGDATDVGGAAVGAHHQHVGGGRGVLEAQLVVDGDVVGEEHHAQAGGDGVEGLGHGVLTGHRDDGQGRPRARSGRAEGARRHLVVTASAAGVAGAAKPGERVGDRRQPGIQTVTVVGPDGDDQVVGAGRVGYVEAHAAQHVDVQLGRHRHLGGGDARGAGDGAGDLHQAHRVVVGAAAQLDVGRHAALRPVGTSSWVLRWLPWRPSEHPTPARQGGQGGADAGDRVGARGVADGEHGGQGAAHGLRVSGDGGVDQGDDRSGCVAVGGRVEQGGRDRGGGAEPRTHGIRERLTGAERVGDEQRAGERVIPRRRQPGTPPHQTADGIPELGAQVAAPATA